MSNLPIKYRKGTNNLIFNVDYFDYLSGAGYKKFYLAGLTTTTGTNQYILTADNTIVADSDNSTIGGNGTDLDFDIEFNNPATIAAADALASFPTVMSSGNADYFNVTIKVIHYDGSTETELGTVTCDSDDGDPTIKRRKTCKLALTRKFFAVGDILRVNITISSSQAAGTHYTYIDPSGHITDTDAAGGTSTSDFSINIPFEVND